MKKYKNSDRSMYLVKDSNLKETAYSGCQQKSDLRDDSHSRTS